MWGVCGVLRDGADSNKVVMWGAYGVFRDGAESNKVVMWGGEGHAEPYGGGM